MEALKRLLKQPLWFVIKIQNFYIQFPWCMIWSSSKLVIFSVVLWLQMEKQWHLTTGHSHAQWWGSLFLLLVKTPVNTGRKQVRPVPSVRLMDHLPAWHSKELKKCERRYETLMFYVPWFTNSNSAVGSTVSPQNECPNPNLWYLGMQLYLEIGPCRCSRVKMRSSRQALIQWLVSWQKEKGHVARGSCKPGSTNDFWHKQKLGRGARPWRHLDLGLLASRAVRKWILAVYATQFVVLCYRRKPTPIGSTYFVFSCLLFYAWC